ncbi:MAG TPA: hypothetical protein VFD71_09830 [Planctomycetota bacterium]|jgi:hypothetical protein|nr:hypothetical protein [Planctomycetota bacterium]
MRRSQRPGRGTLDRFDTAALNTFRALSSSRGAPHHEVSARIRTV